MKKESDINGVSYINFKFISQVTSEFRWSTETTFQFTLDLNKSL